MLNFIYPTPPLNVIIERPLSTKIENKTNNLLNPNEIERPALKGAITHKIDRYIHLISF